MVLEVIQNPIDLMLLQLSLGELVNVLFLIFGEIFKISLVPESPVAEVQILWVCLVLEQFLELGFFLDPLMVDPLDRIHFKILKDF